ncbi:MAG: TlpA family protein disulfide reductase [Isosphaeraceae bacterium]
MPSRPMLPTAEARPVRPARAVVLAAALLALAATPLTRGDDGKSPANAAPAPQPILNLADGGFTAGELGDTSTPGILRWQSSIFVTPFDFRVQDVNAIQWPPPASLHRPTGDFCFELAAGDVLFGKLLAVDDKKVEIDVPRLGRLHVDRSNLHRIYRWHDGADLIYLGPNGLTGWTEPAGQKNWREESGQPTTDKEGAAIRGDFKLPTKAVVEFEISWKTKPDFVFALGVDDKDATVKRAFRFEAWGGDLVVQRELEQEADLAVVQEVTAGPGRTHLQAYLDQEAGRILVFSPGGKQLADLKVAGTRPTALPGVYLANIRGDVRLEWLRIGRWNGEVPREASADKARVHRVDGSIAYGQVTGYKADTREFVVKLDKAKSRIAADQVSSVFLSLPKDEPARTIRAVYQDGSRVSGSITGVEKGTVGLMVAGIDEPLRLPVDGLRSLVALGRASSQVKPAALPRLEAEGTRLIGALGDGTEKPGASCLVWHPGGSTTASPLKPGVAGKIFYKEVAPPSARAAARRQAPANGMGGMALRFAQALAEAPSNAPAGQGEERRSLYLRSGDVIPSVILGIDDKGVHFRSSISTSTFVPNDKVKALELAPEGTITVKMNKTKRERLLTLPRMQKASPPTHLLRSRNGDYLRARVVMMDERRVRVESRLEERDLPRDRIARIIWLHPEELDSKQNNKVEQKTRVQAVRNDGIRVTFYPEKVARDAISGKSDVLGATTVKIGDVDQLLICGGIEEAAEHLTYGAWKLQNAPEPIEATDDSPGGGGSSGTESPLVGKPAPDFALDLVGGKKFHLADNKGKVIILDFWATWCGPCIQAMPQVEKVAKEFDEKDVVLVAVNLQETPDKIKAMLERHKLEIPRVALDKDGAVAEKYQANAIPQTVVIDPDGNVARLFVGGGAHLGDQLRDAIKATLSGEKPGGKVDR